MRTQKGFTLSEALITLVIIGIVAAITIPVINKAQPDKDKSTYHKALMTITQGFSIANETTEIEYAENGWSDMTEDFLCTQMSENINTSGTVNCSAESSYNAPNFITTDGTRIWGLEGKFNGNQRVVYIDRKLSTAEYNRLQKGKLRDDNHKIPGLKIILYANGTTGINGTLADYAYEKSLIDDFHKISK